MAPFVPWFVVLKKRRHKLFPLKEKKLLFPPGFEPRTFRVLGERDNHYTTGTGCLPSPDTAEIILTMWHVSHTPEARTRLPATTKWRSGTVRGLHPSGAVYIFCITYRRLQHVQLYSSRMTYIQNLDLSEKEHMAMQKKTHGGPSVVCTLYIHEQMMFVHKKCFFLRGWFPDFCVHVNVFFSNI